MAHRQSCVVIGAGISGLAAACVLAQRGVNVTVVEKNAGIGGRARTWSQGGFTFDMGPSFYWMPDVFERFFARFNTSVADHYELRRVDPSYRVVFGPDRAWDLPAGRNAVADLFESVEPGAGRALHAFLEEARMKYMLGMQRLVYDPSLGWSGYLRPELLIDLLRTSVFTSLRSHVHRHFKNGSIRQVMEFPSLFLGATPRTTPALYSLMNHADIDLGTWYPMGGMGRVVQSLYALAHGQGAVVRTGEPVTRILVENGKAVGVRTTAGEIRADIVLASADYHHVEHQLLGDGQRAYSERYWSKATMAPSALLFYLGSDRRLPDTVHHTLFFDAPMADHMEDMRRRRWPRVPLFHLCCTTATDASTAPPGCENLVVLIPLGSGSPDTPELRERCFAAVAERIRLRTGTDIRDHLLVERSYSISDLEQDHHAFGGNAYGLANTLMQTGPLRPRIKSRKVKGLYFAGQLTVPGPGMPPALISGQVAADLILKELCTA